MIVKMIQNLGKRIEKMQKTFNNDLEGLKMKQATTNNTTNEIKNTLEGINSRITEAEERISDLEGKIVEITTAEQNKEKRMKRTEDSLRDLCDNIKCTKIRIIRVPEEEEKKKWTEKIFEEIIVENFPNMEKEIINQVQAAQRVPYRINPRRNTPRQILIKLSKIKYKENILKATRANNK
uniref:L1 transposable element RRM domain-containing protein n=1 Tax=Phocoena sinus TaxID=42100 RepID=A0A8C9CNM8_PHOSS